MNHQASRWHRVLLSAILVVGSLGELPRAWSAESGLIPFSSVDVTLAIPSEYVTYSLRKEFKVPRDWIQLELGYPRLRAASDLESTTSHIPNSPLVRVGLTKSRHFSPAEGVAQQLDRLKSPKAVLNQIARAPDLNDLPGFEVYRPVRGKIDSVIYVKNVSGEQVLSRCNESEPNPGCSVSFQWKNALRVKYFFRRRLLVDLERLHTGVIERLQSFVVAGDNPWSPTASITR